MEKKTEHQLILDSLMRTSRMLNKKYRFMYKNYYLWITQ